MPDSTRRAVIAVGFGGAGALIWNANSLTLSPKSRRRLRRAAEDGVVSSQRICPRRGLEEYAAADISPTFKPNGTFDPGGDEYNAQVAQAFANWRLRIDGMVTRPLSLSVSELRALPSRTQITRHDCVEGWSAIGMWTGVQLGLLLKAAGLAPTARYAVFHCADNLTSEPSKGGEQSPGQYYESIDLVDAFHPQTLIAYALNGRPLDDRAWRASSPARGASARIQAGQIHRADRGHRQFRQHCRRPRRLLGGQRLRMVRGRLGSARRGPGAACLWTHGRSTFRPRGASGGASSAMFSLVGNAQIRALRLIRRSGMLTNVKSVAFALVVGAAFSSFAVAQSSSLRLDVEPAQYGRHVGRLQRAWVDDFRP